jgi:hypothetical protein
MEARPQDEQRQRYVKTANYIDFGTNDGVTEQREEARWLEKAWCMTNEDNDNAPIPPTTTMTTMTTMTTSF